MRRVDDNVIADIRAKRDAAPLPFPLDDRLHGLEGRVLDVDLQLFHRRDQEIALALTPQDAGEQAHERLALDDAALVDPASVRRNAEVHARLPLGVPAFHGRAALSGEEGFDIGKGGAFVHDAPTYTQGAAGAAIVRGQISIRMNRIDPPPSASDAVARLDTLAGKFQQAKDELARTVIGQDEIVEQVLVTLLAGGHALLVGLPGLAKTRLVKAAGTVLGLDTSRVQFTPDLVPSDILGAEILENTQDGSRQFRFVEGPVFSQLLMADEINRASPRTQSALLEAMQERQVTAAGTPRGLPRPFHVLATQNPIEQDGTYPLPEAQLDRFLMQLDIDFPSQDDERTMLMMTTGAGDHVPALVTSAQDLIEVQGLLRHMPLSEDVLDGILTLVRALRPGNGDETLVWGPGPRAGQALIAAAKARAFLHGRSAPLLADVAALAAPALRHRMALGFAARRQGVTVEGLIADAAAAL